MNQQAMLIIISAPPFTKEDLATEGSAINNKIGHKRAPLILILTVATRVTSISFILGRPGMLETLVPALAKLALVPNLTTMQKH